MPAWRLPHCCEFDGCHALFGGESARAKGESARQMPMDTRRGVGNERPVRSHTSPAAGSAPSLAVGLFAGLGLVQLRGEANQRTEDSAK